MDLCNRKYYAAYDDLGERGVSLVCVREYRMQLWMGYWETLMGCLFLQYGPREGVLRAWQSADDLHMWPVPDPALETGLLKGFSLTADMRREYGGPAEELEEIRDALVVFFEEAQIAGAPVYIDEA